MLAEALEMVTGMEMATAAHMVNVSIQFISLYQHIRLIHSSFSLFSSLFHTVVGYDQNTGGATVSFFLIFELFFTLF